MNKTAAYIAVALIATVAVATRWKQYSDAHPKVLSCLNTPQWWSTNAQGAVDTEIRVCFGEDHKLYWSAQPTPPPAPAQAAAPAPARPTDADLDKIKAQLREELKAEAAKAKPAPKAAAKKASADVKPSDAPRG